MITYENVTIQWILFIVEIWVWLLIG